MPPAFPRIVVATKTIPRSTYKYSSKNPLVFGGPIFGSRSLRTGLPVYLDLGIFGGINHATALHSHPAVVHSKIIRNFAVVGHFEYREVGLFANLERPNPLFPL